MSGHALILGGTAPARDLAAKLVDNGWSVTSSLAGRVSNPRLPVGEVRIGGFGGPEGLANWIREHGVDVVIDATHPFAERISHSAVVATKAAGIPLLALFRPGWEPVEGDQWIRVHSMQEAAAAVQFYERVLLTIGRQQLGAFSEDNDREFIIRCVEQPDVVLPQHHRIVLDRGPFTLDSEREFIANTGADVLVTKNSGGPMYSKLHAARELGIPVVMVDRPTCEAEWVVTTVDEAVDALAELSNSRSMESLSRTSPRH